MFQLLTIQENISDKEMPCDAVSGFFDYMRRVPIEVRNRQIVPLFLVRNKKIRPTEKYLYIEVVDDETGEMYSMNCKKEVHEYCLKNNIYPSTLIELLKK